jgi:hypothetical protein
MDITKMISDLHAERAALDEAIRVLERLIYSQRRRRGRPPAWLSSAKLGATAVLSSPRPKRVLSAATRKKMAESQRKRWAAARKAKNA